MAVKTTLPTDSNERKRAPLLSGALRYAPASFMLMAETAEDGNRKHNPGEPLHHARGKSSDHGDCIERHLVDIQDILAAFERGEPQSAENLKQLRTELGQFSWRANILVQELAEKYLGVPLAPGARLPAPEADKASAICARVLEAHPVKPDVICAKPYGHEGPCVVLSSAVESKPGKVTRVSAIHGTDKEPHEIDRKTGACWCGYRP